MTTLAMKWLRGLATRLQRQQAAARPAFGGERQRPVSVYTAANAMEAELVRALLASEGIPAFSSGEALGTVYGLHVGPLAEVEVLVTSALAPRARQIIDERHLGLDGWEEEAGEAHADEEEESFSSDS